jgi:hypothetical protein
MTILTRTLRLFSISAVAAIVALGVMVASPTTSSAAPAADSERQVRNLYGSIAISVDQAWGISYNYRTKRAAKAKAKRECKANSEYPGRCTVTVWVRNGCAATAVKTRDGFVTRYASDFARTRAKAKRDALKKLSRPKKIIASTCTS